MHPEHAFIQSLPTAVYTTDPVGRITAYNAAAAALWGTRPEDGQAAFCGSWKLYRSDGSPLPHDLSPMAQALKERRSIHAAEVVAERPDGRRLSILAYPTPLFDEAGTLVGAVNMLIDITARRSLEPSALQLAAIVESSDDAILAKDLDGRITSWNQGAERLFGYRAEEVVGRPVTILIPDDRQHEEPDILARVRRGERVGHYETVRRRKDGTPVDVSLVVSPVRNRDGVVVGASKIARDITERRRAEERQQLLIAEMSHRVKNLLVLAGSIVSLSARSATTVEGLAADVRGRLGALARAHDLTLPKRTDPVMPAEGSTSLHALIRAVVSPFDDGADAGTSRISIAGPDAAIAFGGSLTSFALLLHEFTTNAAKYGALSVPGGRIDIACAEEGDRFVLVWTESGGPPPRSGPDDGFGSMLARATVKGQLDGDIERVWHPDGLTIRLTAVRDRLS